VMPRKANAGLREFVNGHRKFGAKALCSVGTCTVCKLFY
jgi:hypothetical protein